MNKFYKIIFFLLLLSGSSFCAMAQHPGVNSTSVTRAAGPEYRRSSFYQSLWGHNYRNEWTTPVSFPIVMLDTMYGGLKPYKVGGGHQSKSLRLKTKDGKEYAMRSVNKSLKVLIPEIFYNTFAEHIVDDEISMSHPYAALTIPRMAEAAKIFHTNPRYVFIPRQPALDTFNNEYGDRLYLLEQRPDEDWSDADNLGNFNKYISSEDVREKIYKQNSNLVNQVAFVKARLFDMFVGDWDRHEDQWKWGAAEKNGQTVYMPIPVDRDQPYSKFDGLLLKAIISAAGARYFQSFDYDIPYPEGFSYERRNIDRFFTNKVTLGEWQNIARQLQQELADVAIEESVHQMPPEIFAISGNEIIAKLKSRRGHLVEYATKYYLFLAKNVEIVGSKQPEYFQVKRVSNNETEVNIYNIQNGVKNDEPYYSRTFQKKETSEIRIFGLSGNDVYTIEGAANKGIKIRVIAGDDEDSIAVSGKGRKVHIYDDHDENIFPPRSQARRHLSSDSMVHAFDYDAFRPEKKLFTPIAGYNDDDRLYVGMSFGRLHHSFRKSPFSFRQGVNVNYSISQSALSATYSGIFPKAIGGWDLQLTANYDAVKWVFFYGLGNETPYFKIPKNYFRMRTGEWLGNIALNRKIGVSNTTISGFFNSVNVLNETDKFITSYLPLHPEIMRRNNFAGGVFNFNIQQVNDSLVPVSGIIFNANARYTQNLTYTKRSFGNFSGNVQFYIPVVPKFSFAISTGAATVTGNPEFYQYPAIGGGATLRGYNRDRFRGKTAFYNSNEFRFITNINTYFMNGKGGLVAFFDNGRVWMPGETSNAWHTAYGGGIIIAPFNIMFFDITYGVSKETSQIQMRSTIKL